MKKSSLTYLSTIIGLLMIAVGLITIKLNSNSQGIMGALPFVMIGIGCGTFGSGMGELISKRAIKNNPELAKQIEIDTNDERNVAIANKAKSKAYDVMTYVFGALMVSFALMGIDLIPILLLVFAYLFVHGTGIYYRMKYEKEM